MKMVPKYFFLVKGVGYGKNEIEAFENALRDAGIEGFNLVPVSSIVPEQAVEIPPGEGLKMLKTGQIVFCVMARKFLSSGKASAAVAVAKGKSEHGYFVEITKGDFEAKQEALETAKRLYSSKFKTEPEELKVISAEVEAKQGLITCVLACAVLICDE